MRENCRKLPAAAEAVHRHEQRERRPHDSCRCDEWQQCANQDSFVGRPGQSKPKNIGAQKCEDNPGEIGDQNPYFQLACIHLTAVRGTSLGPTTTFPGAPWLIFARTHVNRECATHKCRSSMICMLSQGTTMHASHIASIRPPENPVSPAVMLPACFATFRALRTLGELPLPLIARATSPEEAKFASCSEKMSSYFESFAQAVIRGTLSVKASTRKRFLEPFTVPLARSQAKCEASAALPPFPNRKIVRCCS